MTKTHLSPGRLARVQKLDAQLQESWLGDLGSVDLQATQQKDPDISPVLDWMRAGMKGTLALYGAETKNIVAQWPVLCLHDGAIYEWVSRQSSTACYHQYVVPLVLTCTL